MRTTGATEERRLLGLRAAGILDTPPEALFDQAVALAAQIANTPIALITFIEEERQWFKAGVGFDASEGMRADSICTTAIENPDQALVVPDAKADERFADRAAVSGDGGVRFYVGIPLRDRDGFAIGTLCVADPEPRQVDDAQVVALQRIARMLESVLHHRRLSAERSPAGLDGGVETSGLAVALLREGLIISANDAFSRLVGRPDADVIGRRWSAFVDGSTDVATGTLTSEVDLIDGGPPRATLRILRPDRTATWAEVSIAPLVPHRDDQPDEAIDLLQAMNITEMVEAHDRERRLTQAALATERRYRALADASVDIIVRYDLDGVVLDANPQAVRGFRAERADDVVGRHVTDFLAEYGHELIQRIREAAECRCVVEAWRQQIPDPQARGNWYAIRFVPVIDGDKPVSSVVVTANDITELVLNEQRLASIALVDPLTGAANRAAFYDRLQHGLDRIERNSDRGGLAVAMIDLDHFKAINDTYGHAIGDEILRAAVAELGEVVRGTDTVARLGGDEFAVVFEEVADAESAEVLGVRICAEVGGVPVLDANGREVHRTASVGVTWTPSAMAADDLVALADKAMYKAKAHGRRRSWADDASTHQRPTSGGSFLLDLHNAVDRHDFELHYQPIVDGRSGRIVAGEALLRWNRNGDLLLPQHFLSALLTSGQIGRVGEWVVRTAIEQAGRWREQHRPDLHVNINLSPSELTNPTLADGLRRAFDSSGVDPGAISLEVTEQALAGTIVSTSTLAELRDVGIGLILDDFGTGVSSMSHLRTGGLSGLKIDRSFIERAPTDPTDGKIVAGIVTLAGSLDLDVVAEGVETATQADWLASIGCHTHQGWLYHRALTASEMSDVLATQATWLSD